MTDYLDANFVIYFIESNLVWGPKVNAYLTSLLANGDRIAVSDLTRLECRVGPLLSGDSLLLSKFTIFFQSPEGGCCR